MNESGFSKQELIMRVADNDFQKNVLEKLARLEERMDTLIGSTQPGRMKMAEDKISALERNDVRRDVYDRFVNAVISVAVSAGIAWGAKWSPR